MVWTISWWTRRHLRWPQEWPTYRVSQWQQCREDFSVVASKPSPFAKNASKRGEHWPGHSEDCGWRFVKTEDLFVLCSTLFDCRVERLEKWRLPRFDCHSRQWSWLLQENCNWRLDVVFCLRFDHWRSIRCMGRRNLVTAGKTAISEVPREEHFGNFLQLARLNPQRICTGGWNYQCSVLQRCNGKTPKQNSTC